MGRWESRRDSNGNPAIWFTSGAQISSTAGLGNVATIWSIQAANAD